MDNTKVKIFIWHDLAGGGRCGLLTEDRLRGRDEMGVAPPFYHSEFTLNEWLDNCVQGDEWYNATDSYTCIGTFEDFEKLKNSI